MTTTAHAYIVDDEVAWRRLNALAAADWEPGSPGEFLYLNALIGDAATMHLATPEVQNTRLNSLTAHLEATGDMGGLHGPLLSLTNAMARRGDGGAVAAAAATWQKFAAQQVPRAVAGAVPVYDTATRALILADPASIARALPPVPTSLSDTTGIINFLNGVDRRIHDAFGNPQSSDAVFDATTASVVSGLNEAAVTIAQMAVIGMLIPGGQAIGAILLVGAGVLAVGAAAVSLFGSLVDLFTSTEPARIELPDAVVPPNPYEVGDTAQPAAPDPTSTDTSANDTSTTDTSTSTTGSDTDTSNVTNGSSDVPTGREGTDEPPPENNSTDTGIPDTREGETVADTNNTSQDESEQGSTGNEQGGEATGSSGGESAGGGGGELESVHDVLEVADMEGDEDAGHR